VGRTIFWIIILFALAIVTQTLGIPVLTSWFDRLVQFIPNLLAALVIVLAGVVASRLVGDLIGSAISQTEVTGGQSITKLVRFVILFIASVVAINQIGIDINFLTNLVVVIIAMLLLGAALAFGLGAKTSISNILGAYYFQKSYHVGNLIKVGDVEGEIVKITTTAVYLKTKNGQVVIPAKVFSEEKSTLLKESNHAD
jgi:small-conductance mechanosensitive channel